jgi:hypothetical protein
MLRIRNEVPTKILVRLWWVGPKDIFEMGSRQHAFWNAVIFRKAAGLDIEMH